MAQAEKQQQFHTLIEQHRKIALKVSSAYSRHPEDRADLGQEIVTQFTSSLVCLALVCGVIHWSRRPTSIQLKGYIRNSTAGRGVIRAEAALADIVQFENA